MYEDTQSAPTTEPHARLIHATPWENAAYAARTCYLSHERSTPETDMALLLNCIRRGHDSVLEHIVMQWDITCTRACSHQLVRHRLASYSQTSQRYTTIDQNMDWYSLGEAFNKLDKSTILDTMMLIDNIGEHYQELLNCGLKPEDARAILPNCTLTTLTMTINMRSFRNLVELRTHKTAQSEIRDIVYSMVMGLPANHKTLATEGLW